jgi:hypothetical protein
VKGQLQTCPARYFSSCWHCFTTSFYLVFFYWSPLNCWNIKLLRRD